MAIKTWEQWFKSWGNRAQTTDAPSDSANTRSDQPNNAIGMEALEDRSVPATLAFAGGVLQFDAAAGVTNDLTVIYGPGSQIEFVNPGDNFTAVPVGFVGVGTNTATGDLAALGGLTEIKINLGDSAAAAEIDVVTVQTNGVFAGPVVKLTIDGQADPDVANLNLANNIADLTVTTEVVTVNNAFTTAKVDITADVDVVFSAAGKINAVGANDVTITATNGQIAMADGSQISSDTGKITLAANTDVILGRLVTGSAATEAITVTATTGSIIDAGDSIGADVELGDPNASAKLTAAVNIGAIGAEVETKVAALTATATAGDLFFVESDGLTSIDLTAANTASLATTIGDLQDGDAAVDVTATTGLFAAGAGSIGTAANPLQTNVTQLSSVTNGGDQFLIQSKALTAVNIAAGAGDVSLKVLAGDVTDADGVVDIAGDQVQIELVTGTFGTAVNPIQTQVNDLKVTTVNVDQFITESDGLTALELQAGTGNVLLNNITGDITDADAATDITATMAIVLSNDGDVGAAANAIQTSVDKLMVQTLNGDQFLAEANGLTELALNAVAGDIELTAIAGDIQDGDAVVDVIADAVTIVANAGQVGVAGQEIQTNVNSLSVTTTNKTQQLIELNGLTALDLDAGTSDIALTVLAGNVLDNDADTDIKAASVVLNVGGGVVGTGANAIETDVDSLTVTTNDQNQFLDEVNGLTALNLTAGAAGNVSLNLQAGAVEDGDAAVDITADQAKITVVGGGGIGTVTPIQTTVNQLITTTAGGNQFFTETDGLTALNVVAGTGKISIVTLAGDLQDADAAVDVVASEVTLKADAGAIGAAGAPIQTNVDVITTSSANDQVIQEVNGITELSLTSANGNIVLGLLAGDLESADAAVDVVATNGSASLIVNGGKIGADATTRIQNNVQQLNTTTVNQAQFLSELNDLTAVNLNAGVGAGGNIDLITGGAIEDGDAAIDITADQAIIQTDKIGSAAALQTDINTTEMDADNGGIKFDNLGPLTIGGLTGLLDGMKAVTDIQISTTGALVTNEKVISTTGSVQLTSTGSTVTIGNDATDTVTAKVDLTISANGSLTANAPLTAQTGTLTLTANDTVGIGDNVVLNAGANLNAAGDVNINSGDDLTLNAGLTITAGNNLGIKIDFGNADPGVGANFVQNATINAKTMTVAGNTDSDSFDLLADKITLGAGNFIQVDGVAGVLDKLNSRTDPANAGQTIDLTQFTLTRTGVTGIQYANIDAISLDGTDNPDAISINKLVTADVTVNGLMGDDTLTVDYDGTITRNIQFNGGGGNQTIKLTGTLVNATATFDFGAQKITYEDQGNTETINYNSLGPAGQITDLRAGVNNFTLISTDVDEVIDLIDGPGNTTQVNFNNPAIPIFNVNNKDVLTVDSAGGNDTFNFNNPNPGTNIKIIKLDGNIGNDVFDINNEPVSATFQELQIIGNADNDNVKFNTNIATSKVTVDVGVGNDTVEVGAGFSVNATLNTDLGDDTVLIGDNAKLVGDFAGGQGNDTLKLGTNAQVTGNALGQEGADNFIIGAGAKIVGTLDGGPDLDTLDLSASALDRVVNAAANDANGVNGDVTDFGTFKGIDLFITGAGNDTFNLAPTVVVETINSNAGNDTFILADGSKINQLNAGPGLDAANLAAYTALLTFNLQANTGDGTNGQEVTAGAIANFTGIDKITGGMQDDVFKFDDGVQIGELDGSLGNDTIDMSNYTTGRNFLFNAPGTLDGIQGTEAAIFNKFDNINKFVGTTANDTFQFINDATATGGVAVDGREGENLLSFNGYTATPVDVKLTALGSLNGFQGTANQLGGAAKLITTFGNISKLEGSTQIADRFTGLDADAKFEIDGTDLYTSTNQLQYNGFEQHIGGSGSDEFIVFQNLLFEDNTFDGGAGNDSLATLTTAIVGETVNVANGLINRSLSKNINFANFETLTTGTTEDADVVNVDVMIPTLTKLFFNTNNGDDQINLTRTPPNSVTNVASGGGADVLTVPLDTMNSRAIIYDPGAATDTLRLIGDATGFTPTYDFTNRMISYSKGGVLESISYTANFDGDVLDDQRIAANLIVAGTAGDDTINVINDPTNTRTRVQFANNAMIPILDLSNKDTVVVQALAGNDTFTVNNPNPGTGINNVILEGGDANDTFNINSKLPGVVAKFFGDDQGNTVFGDDTFNVTSDVGEAGKLATIDAGGGNNITALDPNVTFTGSILGGAGADTLKLGDSAKVLTGLFDGTAGINTLDASAATQNLTMQLNATGPGATGFAGTLADPNQTLVNYQNLTNASTGTGTDTLLGIAGDGKFDLGAAFTYTNGSQLQYTGVEVHTGNTGNDTFNVTQDLLPNKVTVIGVDGFDALTSNSTGVNDSATLSETAITRTTGGLPVQPIEYATIESVTVNGTPGNDNLLVNKTQVGAVVNLNGIGGADNLTVDNTGDNASLTLVTQDSPDNIKINATGNNVNLAIETQAGDDDLFNSFNGLVNRAVSFNAGANIDTLTLLGNAPGFTANYDLNLQQITYTDGNKFEVLKFAGLESNRIIDLRVANAAVVDPVGTATSIIVENGIAEDGVTSTTRIRYPNNPELPILEFANKPNISVRDNDNGNPLILVHNIPSVGLQNLTLEGFGGNDTFSLQGSPTGVQTKVIGGAGDDIFGVLADLAGGNTNVIGGDGNDVLFFNDGTTMPGTADGGPGIDTLDFSKVTSPLNIDLTAGTANLINNTPGTVINWESLNGGLGNDSLLGGDGNETINGGPGNDTLDGGAGNDSLFGGGGIDVFFTRDGKIDIIDVGGNEGNFRDIIQERDPFDKIVGGVASQPIDLDNQGSKEGQNVFSGDAGEFDILILNLYDDLLGRPPSQEEFDCLIDFIQLQDARSFQVVRFILLKSEEYRRNVIDEFYLDILDRLPNEAEVNQALQLIFFDDKPQENLLVQLLASDEYFQNQGGTPIAFATDLFNRLLGRPPIGAEAIDIANMLEDGSSRREVVEMFITRPEFLERRVDAWIRNFFETNGPAPPSITEFLGTPDLQGINEVRQNALDQLLAGADFDTAIEELINSVAYISVNGVNGRFINIQNDPTLPPDEQFLLRRQSLLNSTQEREQLLQNIRDARPDQPVIHSN